MASTMMPVPLTAIYMYQVRMTLVKSIPSLNVEIQVVLRCFREGKTNIGSLYIGPIVKSGAASTGGRDSEQEGGGLDPFVPTASDTATGSVHALSLSEEQNACWKSNNGFAKAI